MFLQTDRTAWTIAYFLRHDSNMADVCNGLTHLG
jgi:hypothetical protein